MSRITINAANYAAQKIADLVYSEKIDKAEKKLREFVDDLYKNHVPQVLRDIVTCYPQVVRLERMIEFDGSGLGHITSYTSVLHFNLKPIMLSKSEFKELEILKNENNKLRMERVKYARAVAKCLVSLKTINAVKREFPEALKYFEKSPDTKEEGAYSELRNKLLQANC